MQRSSNADHEICGCYICACTCSASFRRDQLQSIHTAKHFAAATSTTSKKQNQDLDQSAAASTKHNVIREITSAITEHAKDAIIEVIQGGSPIKPFKSSTPDNKQEQLDIQRAIERSLGVTALSMAKDPMLSGNIALKNELREEMGGTPSNFLHATQENVGHYRRRVAHANNSTSKCSRASRNNLVDLCLSEEDVETKNNNVRKSKMKKRILLKMLKMYKDEKDVEAKNRIKCAMKALDDKNEKYKSEMMDFILEVHTTDIESFDSNDAAVNLIEFADEVDE